jgi:dolichol-phosphate mannosyltransferase
MTVRQSALRSDPFNPQFPPPVKLSDTLVFTCTYNERESIGELLDGLLGLQARCDVLVIDDSSTDGTLDVLAARAGVDSRIGVLVRPRKLGLGSALKLGWLHAHRMGYARIAPLDADLSHDPIDVQRLLDELDAGADVAIGSRFMPGALLDYRGIRRFLSRNANALAAFLLRMPLTEYTTCLKAAKLDRVPIGLVETIENDGYSFQVTCVARFVRAGLKIVEIPIHFRDRHHGASKISKWEALYGIANLLRLAADRRPYVSHTAESAPSNCTVCGRPYVVRQESGLLRCLACYGSLQR